MTTDGKNENKPLTDLLELEKLYLSRTIGLDDGTYGFLFTKSGGSAKSEPSYHCHPCNIKLNGRKNFLDHAEDDKHKATMDRGIFPRSSFTRILDYNNQKDNATYVTPGEPVPPGMEGMVELPPCEIQEKLDEHEEPALTGLEYLVEIVNEVDLDDPTKPNVRLTYLCLLCDKKGTSFNIITHVGSPNHHMSYLRRYFPKTFMPIDKFPKVMENKEGVNSIVRRIAAKVEKKYGRMKPRSVSNAQVLTHIGKMAVINDINAGPHFKEEPEDVEDWMKFINFKYVLRPEQLTLDYPPSPPPPRPKKRAVTPPSLYANKKPTGRINFLRKSSPDIVLDKEVDLRANKRPRRDSLSSVSSSESKDRLTVKDTSPISDDDDMNSRSSRTKDVRRPYRRSPPGRDRGRGRGSPPRHRRPYSPPNRGRGTSRRLPHPPRRPRSRSRSRSKDRSRRPDPRDRPPYRRSRSPHRRTPPGRELPYPHRERRDRSREEEERRRGREEEERRRAREEEARRSTRPSPPPDDTRRQREKYKLDKFKEELALIEIDLLDKLKYHEKNPEKHPLYPEEWKIFWNKRYKELQAEGKDPNTHDFKPEWIDFWDKRMKELHDSELLEKKKQLKDRLDITSDSLRSKSPVSELKNTWHHLTGTEMSPRRRSVSPRRRESSPRRERREREVTPPRREREREHSPRRRELSPGSMRELEEYPEYPPPHLRVRPLGHPFPPRYPPHMMFPPGVRPRFLTRMPPPYGIPGMPPPMPPPSGKVFEAPLNIITVLRTLTVLENQLGSLGPKVVNLLSEALAMEKNKPTSSVMLMHDENCVLFETTKEKLRGQLMTGVVERHLVNATRHAIKSVEALLFHAPKIQKQSEAPSHADDDGIDKEAIAKQIAAALVAQGRPDVTNEELEVLIDAVIQMAKQQAESSGGEVNTKTILSQITGNNSEEQPSSVEESKHRSGTSGLDILQSSYDDDNGRDESMEQLSEQDVKDLLRNFKTLSRKEQLGLITYLSELEAVDPVKVKVYRKYLEIDDPETKKLASGLVKRRVPSDSSAGRSLSSQFFVTATSGTEPISDESDDENYSIEDVYKVAAAKVEEKEKLENPTPAAPTIEPIQQVPEEETRQEKTLDVATMSASQASNILDWIKNNASESTDLFKTLLSGSSQSETVEEPQAVTTTPEPVVVEAAIPQAALPFITNPVPPPPPSTEPLSQPMFPQQPPVMYEAPVMMPGANMMMGINPMAPVPPAPLMGVQFPMAVPMPSNNYQNTNPPEGSNNYSNPDLGSNPYDQDSNYEDNEYDNQDDNQYDNQEYEQNSYNQNNGNNHRGSNNYHGGKNNFRGGRGKNQKRGGRGGNNNRGRGGRGRGGW